MFIEEKTKFQRLALLRQQLKFLEYKKQNQIEKIKKYQNKLKDAFKIENNLAHYKRKLSRTESKIKDMNKEIRYLEEIRLDKGRLLGAARYMKESFTLNNKVKSKNRKLKTEKTFHVPHGTH